MGKLEIMEESVLQTGDLSNSLKTTVKIQSY